MQNKLKSVIFMQASLKSSPQNFKYFFPCKRCQRHIGIFRDIECVTSFSSPMYRTGSANKYSYEKKTFS